MSIDGAFSDTYVHPFTTDPVSFNVLCWYYMHKLYVMVVHLTLPSRYYHDRNWWRTKPRVSMNEKGICIKDHVTSGETDGKSDTLRGLPLITYAARGGWGGQHQCIQMRTRGEGGSEHDQKYAFCTQVH